MIIMAGPCQTAQDDTHSSCSDSSKNANDMKVNSSISVNLPPCKTGIFHKLFLVVFFVLLLCLLLFSRNESFLVDSFFVFHEVSSPEKILNLKDEKHKSTCTTERGQITKC